MYYIEISEYGASPKILPPDDHQARAQSARMSKITNDCLTRSGKGCLATVGVKGLLTKIFHQTRNRREWAQFTVMPIRCLFDRS